MSAKIVGIRHVREFKSDFRRVSRTATRQLSTSVFNSDASWRLCFAARPNCCLQVQILKRQGLVVLRQRLLDQTRFSAPVDVTDTSYCRRQKLDVDAIVDKSGEKKGNHFSGSECPISDSRLCICAASSVSRCCISLISRSNDRISAGSFLISDWIVSTFCSDSNGLNKA